ncbi:MAG TPA: trimeric intracellular cation channel family protein [Brumimicrobium sp.]|nr:trimeric intracellular cation channel family protein [Brumimicrobium sp.]
MGSIGITEIIGTAAFSVAGAFAAKEKKLDIFGVFIIAFITALGGGTLRDMLIGKVPVTWMLDLSSSVVVFITTIVVLIFKTEIKNYHKTLLFFDAIGLGFFTVVGIRTGIEFGMNPLISIALGTITACFGGVIRDVSLSNIPLVFQKEIYATTCIFGGLIFFILYKLDVPVLISEVICLVSVVLFRLLSVRFNWHLPTSLRPKKTT